jgi:uncharacterized protein YjiS (DUF1127 family)
MAICNILPIREAKTGNRVASGGRNQFPATGVTIMRDYALHNAQSHGSLSGAGFLATLWENWKAHRAISNLAGFDDHMLRDIGLTRADVLWAEDLPLSVNAVMALEERGTLRHRNQVNVA